MADAIELLRTDGGRYMWEPEESSVEFFPKGERIPAIVFPLHIDSNTYNGAMRVSARHLLRTHPAEG